ncbi:hypothetical protein GCM10027597_01450 [Saccharopolyspora tripterygii]
MTAGVDTTKLAELPADQVEELACAAHLGVWTQRRLGLHMSTLHWEWADLAMNHRRLALVAPREHGKSESLSVNATAWRSIYTPGIYTYLFALTGDLAEELLARTRTVIDSVRPDLVATAQRDNSTDLILGNGARIRAAGAGKRTRGGHPDVIIGDDVLDDENAGTSTQRRKIHRWWFGSVVPMAHPGTMRRIQHADGTSRQVELPATRVHLVGTPFHAADLLMSMRDNPLWSFRRYAAEFHPRQLVGDTFAVEARR